MQSLTLESATEKTPGLVGRLAPRLHAKAFTGGLIVLTFIVVGILGPALAPYDPNKQELTAMTKPPQGIASLHVLGTDNLGRDVFSRVIYGARVSLLVAFAVVFISGFVGISLGAISGYFGGKTDFLIQKLVEVVWAFPPLLLGITIMAFLGQGLFNLILALVVQRWIPYCRVVRGQALSLRTREFVVASRCLGARNAQIILRHILPNVIQNVLSHRHLCHGIGNYRGSQSQLFGCRGATRNSHLGHHARRCAYLYQHGVVAAALSRSLHLRHCARH